MTNSLQDKGLSKIRFAQQELCKQYASEYVESSLEMIVGLSLGVQQDEFPIHGLRHPIEKGTTGWYIWHGDYSDDPEFFQPVHVRHLIKQDSLVLKYLGLAPGWRFLMAPDYEDVWQDLSLLDV